MSAVREINGLPLLERIGEGGIADVFRSRWQGKDVALKVLRETDRVSLRKRFLREGRLLQRMDHMGLVRCYDVCDGDQPFLVLELLRGSPLDERIGRKPLSGDEAVHLAGNLLRVLQFLHDRGIVHRDVKASNVFCGDENRVVLMDLGLAVDPSDPITTTLGDVLGTYAYMAPEQIAGAESDYRTDLYSLGITLYEAVCGTRPYQARGASGWLSTHRQGGATPLVEVVPTVPLRLAGLVDRLMAKDPAGRPPSAALALALLTGVSGVRRDLRAPPLVGRDGAQGAIEAVLDAGGWLQVTGPTGAGFGAIGKLARRLAREASMESITLRGRTRITTADLHRLLVAELGRFDMLVEPALDSIRTALASLAGEGGLLVVVEDVDALATAAREELIQLTTISQVRTVHLGVDLPDHPGARTYQLRALDIAELRAMLRGMLDSPAVPAGLDLALREASGGAPGVAVALLREQAAAGALWCDGWTDDGNASWRWDGGAELLPGRATQRMFERALRRLPALGRIVLETLALAGVPVPLDVLLLAVGADPSGIDLGPLQRHGFVNVWADAGEEWVALSRAALEPALTAGLSAPRRKQLHTTLTKAVKRRALGDWEERFLVIHASLGSGSGAEALRLVDYAEQLARSGRPRVAIEVLGRGGGGDGDAALTARRALVRAEALRGMWRLREAREALVAGERLAFESNLLELCNRAEALGVEIDVASGQSVEASRLDRVEQLASHGNTAALLAVADHARHYGQFTRAEALYRAALSVLPPNEISRQSIRCRLGLADVCCQKGATDEAERMLLALARELRGGQRNGALADAFLALAHVQRIRGNFSRAAESIELSDEAARRAEVPARAVAASLARAWIVTAIGTPAEAAAAVAATAAAADPQTPWPTRGLYHEVLAQDRRRRGDLPAALAAHVAGHEAAKRSKDGVRVAFHGGMAAVYTASAKDLAGYVERLGSMGAHRLLAQLMLAGALIGRDTEILDAAEREARLAGDPLLLLEVLHAGRLPTRQAEARGLARRIVDGVQGSLGESIREHLAIRWALRGS